MNRTRHIIQAADRHSGIIDGTEQDYIIFKGESHTPLHGNWGTQEDFEIKIPTIVAYNLIGNIAAKPPAELKGDNQK